MLVATGAFFRRLSGAGEFRLGVGALRLTRPQQMAARHEQIGKRAGHEQPMRVLVQSAVADPGEAEDALDDEERVFNPGPDF